MFGCVLAFVWKQKSQKKKKRAKVDVNPLQSINYQKYLYIFIKHYVEEFTNLLCAESALEIRSKRWNNHIYTFEWNDIDKCVKYSIFVQDNISFGVCVN